MSRRNLRPIRTLITGVNAPRPHGPGTPADVGLGYYPVTIDGPDNIRLGAWFCPGKRKEPLILLFHGYAADKSSLIQEAKVFHDLGYPALLVDFRGSGESSESFTTIGYLEAEDIRSTVSFVRSKLPEAGLIFYGSSMGAAAILCAVHRFDLKPDAIILEAVFDRLITTVRNRFHTMGIPSFPNAELLLFWGGVQVGFKPQVPGSNNTHEVRSVNDRYPGNPDFLGQFHDITNAGARTDGIGIGDYAAFIFLDLLHFPGLNICAHILVDYSDTAFLGNRNCQA